MSKTVGVILAGGTGSRFGSNIPKQFLKLGDKTILEITTSVYEKNPNIEEIIIVSNPDFLDMVQKIVKESNFKKVTKVIPGGRSRQESSWKAIEYFDDKNVKNILFHDAVRPFLSQRIINDIVIALEKYQAVDVAIPSADTLIKVNNKKIITEIPKRSDFMRGQTPQGFDFITIKKAHKKAIEENGDGVTCDCGLVSKYKLSDVYVVDGEEYNIKITVPEDLEIAKLIHSKNK